MAPDQGVEIRKITFTFVRRHIALTTALLPASQYLVRCGLLYGRGVISTLVYIITQCIRGTCVLSNANLTRLD